MPDLIVRPYEGAGPINFNMDPDEVVAQLGDPRSRVPRASGLRMFYDGPPEFRVDFDDNSRCGFIEVEQRSADPDAPTAVVDDIRLTGTYTEIITALSERHSLRLPRTKYGGSGITLCDDLGVGIGFPAYIGGVSGIDPSQVIFAVAYRLGYWGDLFVEDE